MKNKLAIYSFVGLIAAGAVTAFAMNGSTKVQEQGVKNNPHTGHSMSNADSHGGHGGHGGHGSHQHHGTVSNESVQAKLTVPEAIAPNKPVNLAIDIQDKSGKAIAKFDTFQEQVMHLIVVSDDLQFFNHIHPVYKQNGRFEISTSFPRPGSYTLFSDYKPSGQKEQVSVLKTQVLGNSQSATQINFNRSKTVGNTKANLMFSQPTLKAGQEVMLVFDLRDAANNQPVKDLQPYLGERGHLVIVKQSSPLTRSDYIHAHAHAMEGMPPGEVHFMTSFPKPGKYKLWGQFNRNGRIVTTDFWVNVN